MRDNKRANLRHSRARRGAAEPVGIILAHFERPGLRLVNLRLLPVDNAFRQGERSWTWRIRSAHGSWRQEAACEQPCS